MKRYGHLPMSDLAYRDPVFMESLGAQAAAHSCRVSRSDQPPAAGESRRHDRDVRLRANPVARRCGRAAARVQKRARGRRTAEWRTKCCGQIDVGMSRYYEEARELSRESRHGR